MPEFHYGGSIYWGGDNDALGAKQHAQRARDILKKMRCQTRANLLDNALFAELDKRMVEHVVIGEGFKPGRWTVGALTPQGGSLPPRSCCND